MVTAMGYIRGFDGLRAAGVLAVMATHLGLPGFALGRFGVTLFFVLSGFLITRILLANKGAPDYFSRFYTRRALRIFPIYYLALAVLLLASLFVQWSVADWP